MVDLKKKRGGKTVPLQFYSDVGNLRGSSSHTNFQGVVDEAQDDAPPEND